MTIPKGAAGGSEKSPTPKKPAGRLSRAEPGRVAPKRMRPAAAEAPERPVPLSDPGARQAHETAPDATISASVAHAVKTGYEVIAENIKQGRIAAERFRHGEYNIRDAPGDLEVAALRLIQLARELSTTTFDVCERLLKEVGAHAPGKDPTASVPPFRPTATKVPAAAVAKPADMASMALTIRFTGAPEARAHTLTLSRPRRPTAPGDITAGPLASKNDSAAPLAAVTFSVDMTVEGLVVTVAIPKGQPPGVYSGLVHAKGDDVPLGVLTVEILK